MTEGRSLRFSIYLLKPAIASYADAFDPDYLDGVEQAPSITTAEPNRTLVEANLSFWWQRKSSQRLPKFYPLLSPAFDLPDERLYSSNMSGVLFLTAANRKFAITFGYGHNFLREDAKVRDFGLKTALGAMDEEAIKDIEFSTPEAQPYQTKKQTGKGGGIFGFGISDVYDIIKFASGKSSREAGELGSSSVGGNDALKFNSKCAIEELPQKCARALQIYEERWYATRKNFGFIDYIRHEKDPSITSRLDEMLCQAFVVDASLLVLSPPDIVYEDMVRHPIIQRIIQDVERQNGVGFIFRENPRCLLAIEIEFSTSSKHILGGFTNASMMGLVGVVIGPEDKYAKIARIAKYAHKLKETGKAVDGLFLNVACYTTGEFMALVARP